MSTVDYTQLLRLEVERAPEPGELLNLVQNPSGELGAWGWVTPVAGSSLRAVHNPTFGSLLSYISPGGGASYFYTEPMPVVPGTYAAASWLAPLGLGQYAAKVEWLDNLGAVTGSSTGTGLLSPSETTRGVVGAFVVPAAAAYCRLRFDHYATGGGNPGALTGFSVRDVTLTAATTAAGVSWQRTNLMPTPTGAGGLGGWGAVGGTVGTSTSYSYASSHSFKLTKTGGPGPAHLNAPLVAVRPGWDYALQFRAHPNATARKVTLAVRWLDAAGKEISTVPLKKVTETAGAWTAPVAAVATAPTNAASGRLRVEYGRLADREVHYVDAVMVEMSPAVGSYFDGNTPDGATTYTWAGTPYASASLATGTIGDPGVDLVPVPYQNILGPTHEIGVDRAELNVGTLTVKLFDAILDPTQSDLIQQGKRIRLTTADGEVIFAGKVLTGSVTYHLLAAQESKRAEVTLTAVDAVNPLAAAPRREGVATIAELPYVLEGAGVPWSVNGSGDQVPSATVVAYNDNASALDQVAVTRDSVLGYAWVDRNGVLQAWDADEVDATVAAVLDETTYTADLDISFDLDRIVNSVTVRVLRVIATTGATEEVTFGPYVDAGSYRQYGEHAAEYSVQGIDATDTAAIEAFAQRILDASAAPRLRVNTMVLPIRSADDLPRGLLDLYDLVNVVNGRAGLDENARVTSIQHSIVPGKWAVTLGFSAEGAVASPTSVPAPPPSVGQVKDEIDQTTGTLQDDLDELNNVTLPQVQADLSDLNSDLAGLNGMFPITSTNISDGAITTPKMTANSINGDRITANTLHANKIVANSITGDRIAANTISGDKIVANSISADKLAANAIDGKSINGVTVHGGTFYTAPAGFESQGWMITTAGILGPNDGVQIYNDGAYFPSGLSTSGPLSGGSLSISGSGTVYGNLTAAKFFTSAPATSSSSPNAFIGDANGQLQITTGSSRRFKDNIVDLDLDLSLVRQIRNRAFTYQSWYYDHPEEVFWGLIGEELEELGLGKFVDYDEDGQVINVRYANLVVAVLALAQDNADRIDQLEADKAAQQEQIDALAARLDALEAGS